MRPCPAPPYRLYGVPCVVCECAGVTWYPGRWVRHADGRQCGLGAIYGEQRRVPVAATAPEPERIAA